jgi:hypothetical protein
MKFSRVAECNLNLTTYFGRYCIKNLELGDKVLSGADIQPTEYFCIGLQALVTEEINLWVLQTAGNFFD